LESGFGCGSLVDWSFAHVVAAFFSTLHKASNYLVAPMCATSASLYPLWGFNFLRSLVHNWTLWWPHTLVRVAGDCCTNLL